MTDGLTASDLVAIQGNRNDGLFGDNGAWWIIVLFLFAFCGYGNGGVFGGSGGGVANNYVLASDFANIERKIDGVNNGLCDGFYAQAQLVNGTNMAMANGFAQAELARANAQSTLMAQLNNMAMANQACCCDIRNDVNGGFAQTNYNLATQACDTRNTLQNASRDIIDAQNAGTRAILEALNAQQIAAKDQKIADQAAQINALQLAASQVAQNQYLVNTLRPQPVPSFPANNLYGYMGGCGCNC